MPTHDSTRVALLATGMSLLACMSGGEQPQVCTEYMDCVDESSPSTFLALEPTYGADGSCWKEGKDARAACEQVCFSALPSCESDADTDSDSDSDSDSDADTDADPDFEVIWDQTGVQVNVTGPTSGFDFGIAETGSGDDGWYGEDCHYGMGSWQLCHSFYDTHRGELVSITDEFIEGTATLSDVREGETTLSDESFSNRLTYVVTFDSGFCMVMGNDPSYYLDSPSFSSCELR